MGITVEEAAQRLGKTKDFVYNGLQQGVLPFGVAVKMTKGYSYYVSQEALEKFISEGVKYEIKN